MTPRLSLLLELFVLSASGIRPRQIDWQQSKLPDLELLGQMFYSSNVSGTVDFILRYIRGSTLLPECTGPSSWPSGEAACIRICKVGPSAWGGESSDLDAKAAAALKVCKFLTFVRDETKPSGSPGQETFLRANQEEFLRVALDAKAHVPSWSPWLDHHIGFNAELIDVQRVQRDGVARIVYHDMGLLRITLPYTWNSLEFSSLAEPYPDVFNSLGWGIPEPEPCRNHSRKTVDEWSGEIANAKVWWWKSTFAAVDLEALSFVEKAFGAREIGAPFPRYANASCVNARWFVFADPASRNVHSLHFVLAPRTRNMIAIGSRSRIHSIGEDVETRANSVQPQDADMAELRGTDMWTTQDMVDSIERVRDLEAGAFDQYLLNGPMYWTRSLDPFVHHFRSSGIPFFAGQLADDLFALFVGVPKNGVVFQLRGRVLTAATPVRP